MELLWPLVLVPPCIMLLSADPRGIILVACDHRKAAMGLELSKIKCHTNGECPSSHTKVAQKACRLVSHPCRAPADSIGSHPLQHTAGACVSVWQHRGVPRLLAELTPGAFPRCPSEDIETCQSGFAAQDSPCCSHSGHGCRTLLPAAQTYRTLIKAAGFPIRFPEVTPPWAGASGTVTPQSPFSSLVVTLSTNRR